MNKSLNEINEKKLLRALKAIKRENEDLHYLALLIIS